MAFPVPSHLPRRPNPHDVSSEILMKIDQATNQTLTASLATSWLAELESTIQDTKSQIHNRIHSDLPNFEQQLESSKSVQTRLQSLVGNVADLNQTLSDPETGLVPTLVRSLTAHATLAQQSRDASVRHETLLHLSRCRKDLGSVLSLVQLGKLPQAVDACKEFDQLLQATPPHVNQTNVMTDLKRKFQATKSRTEEQLSEAYSRGVVVFPKCLTILSTVAVRQSETTLSLSEILNSLSPSSLSNHLTTLRRDLMTHYVDYLLEQPTSITITSENIEERLTLFPSPPNSENLTTRLDNLSAALKFLSTHFMACLPASEKLAFSRSLCKPTGTSVLSKLLIPSLPSSFELLPQFLEVASHAVAFEDECIVQLLGDDKSDRPIKEWVDGMGGHYERQRRMQILDTSRVIILAREDTEKFFVEIDILPEKVPDVIPVQDEADAPSGVAHKPLNGGSVEADDSWGFDEETAVSNGSDAAGDGWGFDDEADPDPSDTALPLAAPEPEPVEAVEEDSWGFDEDDGAESQKPPNTNGHDDAADAWGWDDDAPAQEDTEAAWSDPWDDPPEKPPAKTSQPRPPVTATLDQAPLSSPSSTASPRMATRLEKLANKGKKHLNGSSPLASPALSTPVSSRPALVTSPRASPPPAVKSPEKGKRPPPPLAPPIKERYSVSNRMRQVINIVEDVLDEGQKFATSKIFRAIETSSPPGTVLLQSATSILDLYRGLYPVKFASRLKTMPEAPMQFSNDCLYLGGEIVKMEAALKHDSASVKERLAECRQHLKVTGDSWFEDTIERHSQLVNDTIVKGAEGFTFMADQDRYDDCETAINQVVQEIKRLAQRWKGILTKSKYYTAIGMLTDAALSRLLEDVLALPDIPAVESHRIRELCQMLNGLEALFIEDGNPDPFPAAYVPSWLKFSYLSELLDASMVDIVDLFESGALVDFEVDELVRLVRALFADNTLRTNTISKLTGGRP